jgi:hypothetical protein
MRVSWRALLVLAFIASLVLGEGEAIRGPVHRAQGGRTVASQGMATEPTGYLSLLQADLPLLPDFILTEALQPQQVNNVTPLLRGGEGVKVGIIDSCWLPAPPGGGATPTGKGRLPLLHPLPWRHSPRHGGGRDHPRSGSDGHPISGGGYHRS